MISGFLKKCFQAEKKHLLQGISGAFDRLTFLRGLFSGSSIGNHTVAHQGKDPLPCAKTAVIDSICRVKSLGRG